VAKNNGTQTHPVFDEFVTVDIPHPTSLTSLNKAGTEEWILVVALRIGVAASRNKVMGASL
jgi:hypothetical protein